jgi:transposase
MVLQEILENISVESVIVMDNALYHSCKSKKCPNSSTRKVDIQAWLTKHNIPFDKKLLRPELLALAKTNKPEPQYIIDDIAKEKGHIILRLLPYHPDLNPIELVWAQLKKIVSSRNFNNKLNDVLEITKAAFTEISVQNWENMGKHVINVEEEYTRKDIVIDQEMDNLLST